MLPMSMLSNEVVHLYPDSYWVQWLNGALIHTFWQWTFILSNASLFALLPFSYFFTESEGFSGQKKGLMSRVYETITVLVLLAVLVLGMAVLALAFFDHDNSAQEILMRVSGYYVQYLYSFLLCICVVLMVVTCAPLGFTTLFDAMGHLLVKPKLFENNDNRIEAEKYEEEALERKLKSASYMAKVSQQEKQDLQREFESTKKTRLKLERRKRASALERNLGYPLAMILLLVLTGLALCMVSFHILKLVFVGDEELHPSTSREDFGKDYRNIYRPKTSPKEKKQQKEEAVHWWWQFWLTTETLPTEVNDVTEGPSLHTLGANSLSPFGIFGTFVEVSVVLYLMLASVVGLYNMPGFRLLKPQKYNTEITKIILNCLVVQLLSSSLPVLSRVLGITVFELQGNFGKFSWLGNFYIIFGCNVGFAAVTALCLVNKFTLKMRRELYKALRFRSVSITPNVKRTRPPDMAAHTSVFLTNASDVLQKNEEPDNNSNDALQTTLFALEKQLKEVDDKICSPSRTSKLTSRKFLGPTALNAVVHR
uniref:Uncharacterized protein n=1 Tax=Ciona intestinalis TaxID=7719 RepID=H2XUT2_CIOIN